MSTRQVSLRTVPTISPTINITSISLTHINIAFSPNHSFHLISALSSPRVALTFEHNHHGIILNYKPLQRRLWPLCLYPSCSLTSTSSSLPYFHSHLHHVLICRSPSVVTFNMVLTLVPIHCLTFILNLSP